MEKAFKIDIAQLKTDTTLGTRLESLEQRFDEALPTISMLKTKCKGCRCGAVHVFYNVCVLNLLTSLL